MRRLFLLVFILTMGSQISSAQTIRYVRAGATGSNNGSDWTNAYKELGSVSYTSGGAIYIGGGTYNTGLPSTSTGNVTVKRATVADHGTGTGWQDAYDGQVTVTAQANKFLDIGGGSGFTFDGMQPAPGVWRFRVVGQVS